VRFIDFFSGIGGFHLGMQQAGHECVGWCEIDKFARQSYEAIHETEGLWTATDITRVTADELPDAECFCAGFPCQAFSIAGKRRGFDDTRGTLIFEVMRLAAAKKPKVLILENVKGLLSHDKRRTFATILTALTELGYDLQWQVLNSKDFGVPQNRERVFIVGHLRGTGGRAVFPIIGECEKIDEYGLSGIYTSASDNFLRPPLDGISRCLKAHNNDAGVVIHVLTPDRAEKRQNGRRFKDDGDPAFTVTAQDVHGVLVTDRHGKLKENNTKGQYASCLSAGAHSGGNHSDMDMIALPKHLPKPNGINNTIRSSGHDTPTPKHNFDTIYDSTRIRRLTPLECWRLQGFPDWAHQAAVDAGVSESQRYKQAGNSVTVNVVYEIARLL